MKDQERQNKMDVTENPDERISIWIVEDNRHFRETMVNLINGSERLVCRYAFDSCEDALQGLRVEEPPQVILLDIGLKGMNGIEGIRKFKAITPSTHIIMLTILEDNGTVFDAICEGASGYLLKDTSPERVIDAVREVVSGGAPMNGQIARKVIEMFKEFNPPKGNYGLTGREKEILAHLVDGLTKKQISDKLCISFQTVNTHIKNIYEKLHVNTRGGVVAKAFRERLI